ncbi:MAG: T9SS type A sorting domain-containing protein [Cytophagales bacterium]|nr:T9SS type A sorting domain-containing protein [Cytophagales bacterium]
MKKLYSILFVSFLSLPDASAQLPLADFYSHSYIISDQQRGFPLRRRTVGFSAVFTERQGFLGGNDQKWLVMPLYPGSDEYIIASKHDGSLLNAWPFPTLPANVTANYLRSTLQIFKLEGASGMYAIKNSANNERALTAGRGTAARRMLWNAPAGAVYWQPVSSAASQRFSFMAADELPYPVVSYREKNTADIQPPPSPANIRGEGLCTECNETFVAETIIPFAMVSNDLSRVQQANNFPYYRLEYSRLWVLIRSVSFPQGLSMTGQVPQSVGMNNASVPDMLGISVGSDGVLGYTEDGAGSIIAASIATVLGKETRKVATHVENTLRNAVANINFTATRTSIIAEYQLVERYRLYRADGSKVMDWDVKLDPAFNKRTIYVEGQRGGRLSGENAHQPMSVAVAQEGWVSDSVYEIRLREANTDKTIENAFFTVNNVYPNPASSVIGIDFYTPDDADVNVSVCDLAGRAVKKFNRRMPGAKTDVLEIDCSDLQSGMYVLKTEAVSVADPNIHATNQQKILVQR